MHSMGHGGREQHRLPLLGNLAQHPLDLRAEAHIEHPVRLIEDKRAHILQVHPATPEVIQKSARGRSDDLEALLERGQLRVVSHPPVDRSCPNASSLSQSLGVIAHLLRQFSRGAQDQNL